MRVFACSRRSASSCSTAAPATATATATARTTPSSPAAAVSRSAFTRSSRSPTSTSPFTAIHRLLPLRRSLRSLTALCSSLSCRCPGHAHTSAAHPPAVSRVALRIRIRVCSHNCISLSLFFFWSETRPRTNQCDVSLCVDVLLLSCVVSKADVPTAQPRSAQRQWRSRV